jgi:hypothetical protein
VPGWIGSGVLIGMSHENNRAAPVMKGRRARLVILAGIGCFVAPTAAQAGEPWATWGQANADVGHWLVQAVTWFGNLAVNRSVAAALVNHTGGTLNKSGSGHDHGSFWQSPPGQIAPGGFGGWLSAQSGVATGTEGWVSYKTPDGVTVEPSWDNPYIGSNSCDVTLSGSAKYRYRVTKSCGSGNVTSNQYDIYDQPSRWCAVFRPSTSGEWVLRGVSQSELQTQRDWSYANNWRVESVQPFVWGGQIRYNAVFRPGSFGERSIFNWSYDDFRAEYDRLWSQGWRISWLRLVELNGQHGYSVVFRQSTSAEWGIYREPDSTVTTTISNAAAQGWRIHTMQPYADGSNVFYILIFKPGTGTQMFQKSELLTNLSTRYTAHMNAGRRLLTLTPFVVGGQSRYAAVWVPSTAQEFLIFDYQYDDFATVYNDAIGDGMRLTGIVTY